MAKSSVPFEGLDLTESRKRGGIASGASRRQAPMRGLEAELEQKILSSKSGWAHTRYLEILMARKAEAERADADAARDRAIEERDRVVHALEEMRAEHAELQVQLAEEIAVLEHREGELRIRELTDGALVELLRSVGEERTASACEALGWVD